MTRDHYLLKWKAIIIECEVEKATVNVHMKSHFNNQHDVSVQQSAAQEAGKLSQQLKALSEGRDRVPNTYIRQLTTDCNSSSGDLTPSSSSKDTPTRVHININT